MLRAYSWLKVRPTATIFMQHLSNIFMDNAKCLKDGIATNVNMKMFSGPNPNHTFEYQT